MDRGDILGLIRRNAEQNSHLCPGCDFRVGEIDFFDGATWESKAPNCDLILVADVVYDAEITLKFFECLRSILGRKRGRDVAVLIAVEQRRRAGEDGRVASPNFDLFIECLDELKKDLKGSFVIEKLALDFEQFFQQYERVNELNLWRIFRESE